MSKRVLTAEEAPEFHRTYSNAENYLWEEADTCWNVVAIFGDAEDCKRTADAFRERDEAVRLLREVVDKANELVKAIPYEYCNGAIPQAIYEYEVAAREFLEGLDRA